MLKILSMIAATTLLFVACDNSSSDPSSSNQEGTSQNTVMDTLPFDTTGIKSQVFSYKKPEKIFTAEGLRQHKEKYGEFWENYIYLEWFSKEYCKNTGIDDNGNRTMKPTRNLYSGPHAFFVREDSLMFAQILTHCPSLSWGACDGADSYSGKITVGNNDFYYNESEKRLIQINDSTVTIWYADGRLFIPAVETDMDSLNEVSYGWTRDIFEGDSMVTFIDNGFSHISDTIFIEKYNVKITDNEYTWIFENETCKAWGYKNDPSKTSSENCNARAKRYNDASDCIRRNMGAPNGILVSLCRPNKTNYRSIWCILDEDMPQK